MIRIFIGTDPQQHLAERAIEASIRRRTTGPYEITWMRRGDPGWDWGGAGWATPFTGFRWAIPEVCGYQGRAIYLDVDMLALVDLRELWEMDLQGRCAARPRRTDVILWDCAAIDPAADPKVQVDKGLRLSPEWNDCDTLRPGITKILHFTRLRTQFWRPYPERYAYDEPHPDPAAVALFWEYAHEHETAPQ